VVGWDAGANDMDGAVQAYEEQIMEIQPRVFGDELTPEQEAQEDRAFAAAKVLREHGYKAKATKYIVTRPTDRAAGIEIE